MTRRLITEPISEAECEALLSRNTLGRLAFGFRDRVDLRPILYVHRPGWIFGRTAPGEKLETILHNRWVALQVDEIRDLWHWESVVAHGALHLLTGEGNEEEQRVHAMGLAALMAVLPEAFGTDDPAPERGFLFGIAVQELSGRRAMLTGEG